MANRDTHRWHPVVALILLVLLILLPWLFDIGPNSWRRCAAPSSAYAAGAATSTRSPRIADPMAHATAAPPVEAQTAGGEAAASAARPSPSSSDVTIPAADPAVSPPVVSAPGLAAARSAASAAPEPASARPRPRGAGSATSLPEANVYFALNERTLPQAGPRELREVLSHARADSQARWTLRGYHDPRGPLDYNVKLANDRATAVRDYLVQSGVGAAQLVIDQPAETTGGGSFSEARRVEVRSAR